MKRKPKVPKGPKPPTALRRTPSSKVSTNNTESLSKWIRIDRKFPLPIFVRDAIRKLDERGHIAYIVGGAVRDFLLGREIKDYDIATSASPDEICKIFPDGITVGKAFGVIKVPIHGGPALLEIATFREDLDYTDHRRPKGVRFSGPVEDALRRDFTVNGLFFDPKTSRILDAVGGMDDLREKVIRTIGDPETRFREDALRLLRAVRFTTRLGPLGMKLDPATALAISAQAKLIQHVSAERIRDELNMIWTGPGRVHSFELLSQLGLFKMILPEVERLRPEHRRLTLRTLEFLEGEKPTPSIALGWAALLIAVGKTEAVVSGESENSGTAMNIAERLKFSGSDAAALRSLLEERLRFHAVFQMREATLQRMIRLPHFEDVLTLYRAEALAGDGNLAEYEFAQSRYDAFLKGASREFPKLLDGKDLIQMGFQPGPTFSEILRVIEDLALERRIMTKDQALEYVVKHFVV